MTITVLGPQRRPTVKPVAGTAATVTAGWREREADDAELDALLGGGTVNLRLHARWLEVLDADHELATAEVNHRAVLEELQDLYAVQIGHAEAAATALRRSSTRPRTRNAVLADAEEALRLLDQRHLDRVAAARADFDAAWRPAERDAVAAHRAQVAELLARAGTLVVTGGHVGVLLHVLRLFAVTPPADVLAWSAGAMALTDRVVLFTDGRAEAYAAGLGLLPDTVLLPHARRRLPVDDPVRLGALARRFAPARCVVLEDGGTLATSRTIAPDGRLVGPADRRTAGEPG
ncbi:MAG TPA: hypothetical protein VLM05_13335 [Mycobacteriales bacterium]|nr:hypothetical protein [Mycobacteriales bacterium]